MGGLNRGVATGIATGLERGNVRILVTTCNGNPMKLFISYSLIVTQS